MKTIAATSVLFVVFACSKQQPAEEPSNDFEHSSVEHSAYGEPNPAYSNSNASTREAAEHNGDPVADAPASSNAGPAPAEPRRVVVERTVQPPSASNPPSASPATPRPDNAVARPDNVARPDAPVVRAERADNTGVNERDRSGATKTPLDQSNSQSDLDITQAIRKAVVGDKALSFNAKNVKIITEGGRVTLRGPVKSADERAKIVGFAKQAAGVLSVDDQLEVAP